MPNHRRRTSKRKNKDSKRKHKNLLLMSMLPEMLRERLRKPLLSPRALSNRKLPRQIKLEPKLI